MSTTPRERPILFSGPMVRAILEGRKTATRRVVKPQPDSPCVIASEICWMQGRVTCIWPAPYTLDDGTRPDHHAICPYGQPGDRLWVRETWASVPYGPAQIHGIDWPGVPDMRPRKVDERNRARVVIYRADGGMPGDEVWTPSIHMPRWASRITLAITRVRVERVQDITEADAIEEGGGPGYMPNASGSTTCVGHRPMFARLWNELNAPRGHGWSVNPWVWVIDFERIKP